MCFETMFVPKLESGEWADVPNVKLGEQRVNINNRPVMNLFVFAMNQPFFVTPWTACLTKEYLLNITVHTF